MALNKREKSFCVLEYARTSSVVTVQRRFRAQFNKEPPVYNSIKKWYETFRDEGCICIKRRPGRPGPDQETLDRVREAYQRSPQKSVKRGSLELGLSHTTMWRILRNKLRLTPYKLQLHQALSVDDKQARVNFCIEMQARFEVDDFADRLIFSDEATFHVSGKVNRHNVRIWGTENPKAIIEHVRDSPKVNVFCAISKLKVYGPFFFMEPTVNGRRYLDMLQNWLMPQMDEDSDDYIFQQDGCPTHFHYDVRDYLNTNLSQRWIGRFGPEDEALMRWPPRSPDLTPCDFFFWGFVKDTVYVPPLPANLQELRDRITAAVALVNRDMLTRVWNELDYRIDVCRISQGAHIEHL